VLDFVPSSSRSLIRMGMPNSLDIESVIALFSEQRDRLAEVRKLNYKHPDYKLWRDTTTNLFERFVSPKSAHAIRFRDLRFFGPSSLVPVRRIAYGYRGPMPNPDAISPADQQQFERACSEADNCILGAITEIRTFGVPGETGNPKSSRPGSKRQLAHTGDAQAPSEDNPAIELLCSRFHEVVKQLRKRYDNRPTLDVGDEYDVQDLMHALLRIFFDDVRPEEWTPSYAGKSARMDFLLPTEWTVIEAKKTRPGLGTKEIGDELIVDIARYRNHPGCKKLICLVYDPDSRIVNPRGMESDLTRTHDGLRVRVVITP
jgi:hypothetical protein